MGCLNINYKLLSIIHLHDFVLFSLVLQISIVGYVGGAFSGDIAIDDLTLTAGQC